MLFLSSTALILIWFDISIFIFLKFIILGESMGYSKKIEYASVDKGLVRIKVNLGNEYATIIHTQISGGRTNGEPLDFVIGLYIGETPKYNFVSGSGNCYYKLAGGYFEIIIAQNTSVDYSVGLVQSSKEIVEAKIINRSGFDLSSYTLATDITFPQFYKNYGDLASLASALGVLTFENRENVTGQTSVDANDVSDGIYFGNNYVDNNNFPSIAGILFQISFDVFKFQFCLSYDCKLYTRNKWSTDNWKPWAEFTGTNL